MRCAGSPRTAALIVLTLLVGAGGLDSLRTPAPSGLDPRFAATVAAQDDAPPSDSEEVAVPIETPATPSEEHAAVQTQEEAAAAARSDAMRRLSGIAWWAAGICGGLALLTLGVMLLAQRHRRRQRSRRRSVYGVDLDARLPAHGGDRRL